MRYLRRQGEVHHDPALQVLLFINGCVLYLEDDGSGVIVTVLPSQKMVHEHRFCARKRFRTSPCQKNHD
jgi:hypothetical protein